MRRTDITSRTWAVDLLNRSLLSSALPVQVLRGLGLHILKNVGPLRRLAIREGLAPSFIAPRLMQPRPRMKRAALDEARPGRHAGSRNYGERARPMTTKDRLHDLQCRIEYVLLRLVAGFFRSLPLNVATAASAWCWRRLAPVINPKRHKRALDNLAIAFPEKSDAERHAIALAHWENLGRVMVETMRIDRFLARARAHRHRQPEHLLALQGQARRRRRRQPAHGQLGAGDPALHVGGRQPGRGLPLGDEPLRRPLSARPAQGSLSRRAVRARQCRRPRRRPEDGARHHGLRAPRRPARPRVRSLRPHRHAGAVLRQAMPRRRPSAP